MFPPDPLKLRSWEGLVDVKRKMKKEIPLSHVVQVQQDILRFASLLTVSA